MSLELPRHRNEKGHTVTIKTDEQRVNYFFKTVRQEKKLWILTDQHGCVMVNSEDEDCVPVWPDQASAQSWATQDWQDCQAQSIDLNIWMSRWTSGLMEDGLAVAIYPDEQHQGVVLYPDELEDELLKR